MSTTLQSFLSLAVLLVLAACNGGGKAFEGLDTVTDGTTEKLDAVHISGFTPLTSPVIVTNTSSLFMGVTVPGNVGAMNYKFLLDGTTSLQNSASPFYTLKGSDITSGMHSVEVVASNLTSSDTKTFQVKKNSPTAVVSFSPALTGYNFVCGTGTGAFSAVMNDADNDTYTVSWELDSAPVTPTTPFTNVLTTLPISQFTYTPDCTKSGSHVLSVKIYDGFEVTTKTWTFMVTAPPSVPGTVQILSFTPTANPVIMTATQTTTFAVTVNDGVGTVNYEFMQDNSTVLQTSTSSYYSLNGSTLTPGYHSLKVKASNATSFAEKTFNVRKNTPPSMSTYTPAFTGTSFACTGGSMAINTSFTDFDADAVTVKWKIDNVLVTPMTDFVSVNSTASSSNLNYTPDCTKVGFHSLKLVLSDGYEESTYEWNVSVTNPPAPPGNVTIVTFTPTSSPVVMTDSTSATFAVSVADGAGTVSYEFKKDYAAVLQNGTTPFMVLNGSSFTAGLHTIKVKASNSVSYDEKLFNIRKNTPPAVLSYTPALTGSTINCGQDTLTFNATMSDVDSDAFTMEWDIDSTQVTSSTPHTTVSSTSNSSQLAYTPDCTSSGYHTLTLKVNDGYETTTKVWTFNVINPTVEAITSYFPTSNSLLSLSTENTKAFTVSGSGIGSLTFKWKVDGVVTKTDTSVSTSTLNLDLTAISTGNHTIEVALTDSVTSNDPSTPAKATWTLYRNEKPRFVTLSPSAPQKINISTSKIISASIQDALDTFTVVITRNANSCTTPSTCGLSSLTLPTVSGAFSATFTPTTSFLGDNLFTIKVTDSHGESITSDVSMNVNYFSDICNNLAPGRICTLSGLPGLGSNINVLTQANRVRVNPTMMTQDGSGNFFFTDVSSHTVWFYNVSASPITLLGVTVPANTIYVVAGVGVAGAGGGGQLARKVALNFSTAGHGGGLAWDTDRKELYVADYNNSRVLKIGTDGRANIVCGGSNLQTQGALAKDSRCSLPVDVEFDSTNRRLFISQQNDHIVKYVDASGASFTTWPSYILSGAYGGNSTTSGSTNITAWGTVTTGTARHNQPWGLFLDTADNILYVTDWGSCRIRGIGLPGTVSRTFAGTSVTANNAAVLTTGSCANSTINVDSAIATMSFNKPADIIAQKGPSGLHGFYVADINGNRVIYLNNLGTAVTIGNQTIAGNSASNIFGNGTASPTNPPSGKNSALVGPTGLFKNGTNLYVGIKGNSIIRSLDLSATNGTVGNTLGGTPRAGYSGNTPLDSKLVTFNQPLSLLYKQTGNLMYVSDSTNYSIRSLNLNTGVVQDFIGTGSAGTETQLNTVTTSTRMVSPRGMTFIDDYFTYADSNANCFIRSFNHTTSDQTIMGSMVLQNRTNVIAGFPNSCGSFVGSSSLPVTDANAKLDNPYGVAFDPMNRVTYVASYSSHCILKVTEGGTMQPFIGQCGTAGTSGSPVYGGLYNDPSILPRFPTELIMDPMPGHEGNFFFADHTDTTKAHIKYVNLANNTAVQFPGSISVAKNNIESVFASASSPGYIRSIAAFEDWFCYTSGTVNSGQGNNTITCRNRTTSATNVFGVSGEGGISPEGTDEGALINDVSSTVTLAVPAGLAFTKDGDLIISEQSGHVIRMIKKWF